LLTIYSDRATGFPPDSTAPSKPPSGWKSEPFIGIGHNHQGRIQMVSVRYTAVLEPAEEGGFVVKCLELPVATEGETKEEALANLKEAIEGYLEVKAERLREQTKGERVEVIVEAPSALMA
jgi:predicted RNase H-like HicB family nuclease